jgi:ABC-type multidrug transport system fused ATPase/permease subunit
LHFDREIFLLDDALSAVDVGVEKLLMDTLLLGALARRTRILTTHRLSVLPQVDRVLFLDQGRLIADGKYADLLAVHAEFRTFIETLESAPEGPV